MSPRGGLSRIGIVLQQDKNESKNESKRNRRRRELFKMINRWTGKRRQNAIAELEEMYKESNLKILILD